MSTMSTYTYSCPDCDKTFDVQKDVKGRTRCIRCQNRILISNIDSESLDWFVRGNCPVGAVTNGGRRYQTVATKLDQSFATELMGSSRSIGDAVYAHAWLMPIEQHGLGIFIGLRKIGELPKDKATRLVQPSPYSESPFKDGFRIIRCPCRLTVVNEKKRKLEVCAMESPDVPNPVNIPLAAIDTEMLGIQGELSAGPGLNIKKVTLRQSIDYIQLSDEDAHDVRLAARSNPSGPVYFILPSDVFSYPDPNGQHSVNWNSDQLETCQYHAVINLKKPSITTIQITRQDKTQMSFTWFHGHVLASGDRNQVAVKPLPKALPYYWAEWGRTASFILLDDGRHEAKEIFSENLTHCWTKIKGLEHVNADGEPRVRVFATVRHGDNVDFRREPDNYHDPLALSVWTTDGKQLGYLPRRLSASLNARSCIISGIAYIDEHSGCILLAIGTLKVDEKDVDEYARRVFSAPLDSRW